MDKRDRLRRGATSPPGNELTLPGDPVTIPLGILYELGRHRRENEVREVVPPIAEE